MKVDATECFAEIWSSPFKSISSSKAGCIATLGSGLRSLFHPGGTIEVTWFSGLFSEFVDASAKVGSSDLSTKHVLGSPLLQVAGDRVVAQTSAIIVAENRRTKLGSTTYRRFHDWIERRNSAWKLVRRRAVYDLSFSSFYGFGPVGRGCGRH